MPFDVPAMSQARRDVFIAPITGTKAQAQELAALFLQVVAVYENAIPAILETYTPRPVTDAPADSEAVLSKLERDIDIVMIGVGVGLREWAVRIERWHRRKWVESLFSATRVDLGQIMTGQVVNETVSAFVARNVALAKDLSSEQQRKIADAVFRGYQQRLTAREIAAEIKAAAAMSRKRALRIAGDQNAKLSAALDKERQLEAGFKLGKYRHSGKKHPRLWHKARNGKVYNLKTRREVTPTGKRKAGGDVILAEDWPGFPPFCGCRMGAYLPFEGELGPDAVRSRPAAPSAEDAP